MSVNTMTSHWEAVYSDNSVLSQFEPDGTENLFGTIDQSRLFEFRIYHLGKCVSLFLPTGTLAVNGSLENTDLSDLDNEYRLIYFVRNTHTIGESEPKREYFIGFQTTMGDGKSHKRMVSISLSGVRFVNG